MNLDSLSFSLSQISYSVANLTKKNFKNSIADINRLVAQHGAEADKHLFRCLFSHVDFASDGRSNGKDFHQTQYLIQECAVLITKPNFKSILCCAIDNPLHHQKTLKPTSSLFPQLSKILKLTKVQEVVFGLALFSSYKSEICQFAKQFAKQRLPHLLNSYIDASDTGTTAEGDFQDIPPEVLHLILIHLNTNHEQFGISPQQKEAFLTALRKDLPEDKVPIVLAPLLYPEQQQQLLTTLTPGVISMPKSMMEVSLAKMIEELGYGCTASVEECRKTLIHFDVRELTPSSVAEVIGMMARTPTELVDPIPIQTMSATGSSIWSDTKDRAESRGPVTWNVDIFASVVKDLAPHLNWTEVVKYLDHPGFIVKNKEGLRLLMQCLYRGLQDVFPIELVYRPWKNTEGQLSWISKAVDNPDVLCLADFMIHSAHTDNLKTQPDDDNREIATWKSLELVEALLRLSEAGHYPQVLELFKFPVKACPDLLVLSLLQTTLWNGLKQELLTTLMPVILGNHPNSGIILHYAWHNQNQSNAVRTLIMHAMAEWYMHGEPHDQTRLTRILDVAQDLKALSMLLNAKPHLFVIDLACHASRRGYLKLDKWLSDKIREHREPFVEAVVQFLKRCCPQLMGSPIKDELQAKGQQLPAESISTILSCLHTYTGGGVRPELGEAIRTMIAINANMMLSKRPTPAGVVGAAKPVPMPPAMQALQGNTTALPAGMQALQNNAITNPSDMNIPLPNMDIMGGGPLGLSSTPGLLGTSSISSSFPSDGGVSNVVSSVFPGLASLNSAPGSPGKVFSTSQVTSVGAPIGMPRYSPMQTPGSRLPGVPSSMGSNSLPATSLPSVMSNSMSVGMRGQTLAGLSAAVITKPPPNSGVAIASGTPTAPSIGVDSSFPASSQHFPKEIEDEANSYFQRIYNHPSHPTITIDEVLEMLKRFQDSPIKKEREVFACMLRNLFEEYRFFPQYPEKELHITAVLFGGIIEQGLVTYMDLGMALRHVLDALKRPHGSKMYYFGIAALDRFKTRLKDYPQYCQHLASIPHFSQLPPHLIEYVEYGARQQEPPNAPQGSVTSRSMTPVGGTTSVVSSGISGTTGTTTVGSLAATAVSKPTSATPSKPSIANTTNIDTLLAGTEGKEEVVVPPEPVQDKVFFIFNNLSMVNMDQKAGELCEYIKEEYLPWVSQYMVMKRASIEPNFHTLYASFIDKLNKRLFQPMVVGETYRNIKVLLRSDKGVANFSDRSLLKNLGHWLGMLTLAKNKPILHLDIDLKSLLYEAYYKGAQELLYVVPFVAKVIESCAKSKVFKPPNPWTLGIMNALAELHQEPDLKLNLKFEIEVLCKALSIHIDNDLVAGNYLRNRDRLATLENQLSPPKTKDRMPAAVSPPPEATLGLTPGSMGLGLGLVNNMPLPPAPLHQGSMLPPSSVSLVMPASTAAPARVAGVAPATTTAVTGGAGVSAGHPRPQFTYNDIVLSMNAIVQHININDQLALFQALPHLKTMVKTAIERSIQELLPPVVERSIKIALTTCEQIIKKDFALDPEETRLRHAAHNMVRNMTAGMALITCREPLFISINTNLKQVFNSTMRGATQQQKDWVEQAANMVAQDNTELACAFIQKTAVEKAIPEIDRKLANEYEFRKHARQEGRRYCETMVLTYQAERMPEQIRLKVGGVTNQQISVYEEFARNIPGFTPTAQEGVPAQAMVPKQPGNANMLTDPNMQTFATDEITQIYDKIARDLDLHLQSMITSSNNPTQVNQIHGLLEAVIVAKHSHEIVTALALLQKAVEGLLDGLSTTTMPADSDVMLRYRECHILVLKGLQNPTAYGPQWTNKQVTSCLMECREEFKYNVEAVELLIRRLLVNMQSYDLHLAQVMENGLNYMAVAFAMQLVQRFCLDDKHSSNEALFQADFYNTIETLARIAAHSKQAPEGLVLLIETIRQRTDGGLLDRAPGGPTSMMHSGISQAREFDDPPGLHEKTEYLLREWVTMFHSPQAGRDSTKAFSTFVTQMHNQGILKTDDLITRFFRLCTEMCVDLCYRALAEQTHGANLVRAKCFHTLDAFVRLIALLVKHSGDSSNTVTKINLLNKVLGIVAGVLLQDHEVRSTEFQQLPYHRIFIMLFIELNAPEHVLESINYQVITAFCNTYHILRPAKAPAFSYAWLELVSHRVFIGRMLAITPQQRVGGWNMYAQLLIDLFKFLAPFLRNAELTKPTLLLYKGTLRVLLVLLHDFPEFLCDYHYAFCDVVPSNCIQMRNLILSAFPRNMRLPDPFTPNLKVDMLNDINHPPRIMTNFANMIQPANFKKDLDSYIKTRSPVTLLSELRGNLQVSTEPGMRYNIPLLNALVLYVGTQAITHIHNKGQTPSMSTIAHSSHMDIFQNLAVDLDTEGRFLFLNAIANQLRYPNSHTHYFSCTVLYLFAEANTEAIQEQITRVLLERLIVNRPHPWGLLITFIELIKNPQFKFWKHGFVHCAAEIEKLFDSVARSCTQPRQNQPPIREESQTAEVR